MSDTPKLWRDMTPEEKGALLLAHHEKKMIEYWPDMHEGGWIDIWPPTWSDAKAYRVKPEPKQETVTLLGGSEYDWSFDREEGSYGTHDTHRITFDLIDGKPDCASIRMERIK